MNNIRKRIDRAENTLAIGKHEKQRTMMIILRPEKKKPTQKDLEILGPKNSWITYQEQLQAQGNSLCRVIRLDVDKEYQARNQLKATKNNQFPES